MVKKIIEDGEEILESDEDINNRLCGDTHERNILESSKLSVKFNCFNKQINRIIEILNENNIIDPGRISNDGIHYSEENIRNWIHDVLIENSGTDEKRLITHEFIKDVKCKDIWDKIK